MEEELPDSVPDISEHSSLTVNELRELGIEITFEPDDGFEITFTSE